MKTALTKFAVDFLEGCAAGAVAAYAATPDAFSNPKALAFIVVLGAIDGGISALRRYVLAAAQK